MPGIKSKAAGCGSKNGNNCAKPSTTGRLRLNEINLTFTISPSYKFFFVNNEAPISFLHFLVHNGAMSLKILDFYDRCGNLLLRSVCHKN